MNTATIAGADTEYKWGKGRWQNLLINIHLFINSLKLMVIWRVLRDSEIPFACVQLCNSWGASWVTVPVPASAYDYYMHAWVSVARASLLIGVASIIYSWINYLWDARGGIGPLFPPLDPRLHYETSASRIRCRVDKESTVWSDEHTKFKCTTVHTICRVIISNLTQGDACPSP